jgi:hypothetical protein
LIERIIAFLNKRDARSQFGSGRDAISPLTITGALIGLNEFYRGFDGEEIDSLTALKKTWLPRLELSKRVIMINGTCAYDGIA